MTIHRFLVQQAQAGELGEIIKIVDPAQVKQITKVLRLGTGDLIDVVPQTQQREQAGVLYQCRLRSISKKLIELEVVEIKAIGAKKSISLTVLISLLKGGRFESCIAKLTEIGVDRIVPLMCERTVVKRAENARAEKSQKGSGERMRRWMSIIKEATEQCERGWPPDMVNACTLEEGLNLFRKSDNGRLTFICTERSQAPHLISLLDRQRIDKAPGTVPPSDIYIVIGPEGGFTTKEIDIATTFGCIPCSLGETILRSDTAAVSAAFAVKSFGEFLWREREYQIDTQNHM